MLFTNDVYPIYNNWFRPYALFLLLGFLIATANVFIKAKLKNIPFLPLQKYFFILLPVGLIFASIVGKFDWKHLMPFWRYLEFWKAGMSIHGALIGGIITGIIFFFPQSEKYQISMWVWLDLIAPEILIGQAIGRWGNFFNHEILGNSPVSYNSLKWLPEFIKDNCYKFDLNSTTPFEPKKDIYGNILFFQPLFLYESFFDFILWITIKFLIPKIWKITIYIKLKNIKSFKNFYYTKNILFSKKVKKTLDFAYYEYEPDSFDLKKAEKQFTYKKINFNKLSKKEIRKAKRNERKKYIIFLKNKDCKELTQLQNPYNLIILRCGVLGGMYFTLYNILRLWLETKRDPKEMFIKNWPLGSYIFISLFIIVGIAIIIFTQFIFPNKWRKRNWYYEKSY